MLVKAKANILFFFSKDLIGGYSERVAPTNQTQRFFFFVFFFVLIRLFSGHKYKLSPKFVYQFMSHMISSIKKKKKKSEVAPL
jgi:hypothetical protein